MLDTSLLLSVATQLMTGDEVEVEGQRLPIRRPEQPTPTDGDVHDGRSPVCGKSTEPRQGEPVGSACKGRPSGRSV